MAQSLRRRLAIGSIFWTIGLVGLTNLFSLHLISRRLPGGVQHFILMSSLAAGLLVAALIEIRSIVALFKRLHTRLNDVRAGRSERIEGVYPAELEGVVGELNGLLDHQADQVRRALAKAGDLAHGLKTPLAVLGQEAERLQKAGHADAAAIVNQQVDRMRRQIEYHLAHARAAASGNTLGLTAQLLPLAAGLERTLSQLYLDKAVTISVAVSPEHWVRAQGVDVEEMLGNLLDNGCKWGRHVRLESVAAGAAIEIRVEDDGPGIPAEMRQRVLQRGVRVDETAPGSGFGLAIVRDLAEVYGGSIALETSALGGTRATLVLPSSAARADTGRDRL